MKPRTLGISSLRPLILLLALCLTGGLALAEQVVVNVKEAALRADKTFHANSLATLGYGTRLEVLSRNSGWLQVRHGGTTGWVHTSTVASEQPASAQPGGKGNQGLAGAFDRLAGQPAKPADSQTRGFSEDEVSLAGKGFNAAVEQQYQKSNPSAVNYRAVDEMEKLGASRNGVQQFAQGGGLSASRGQRQGGGAMKQAEQSSSGSILDKASGLFSGGGPGNAASGAKPEQKGHNPLDL
jgi:hypothetical protein